MEPPKPTGVADLAEQQGPRYPLRKRKAIALYPYTLCAWVQPDTLPTPKAGYVDLSVLADNRTAKRTRARSPTLRPQSTETISPADAIQHRGVARHRPAIITYKRARPGFSRVQRRQRLRRDRYLHAMQSSSRAAPPNKSVPLPHLHELPYLSDEEEAIAVRTWQPQRTRRHFNNAQLLSDTDGSDPSPTAADSVITVDPSESDQVSHTRGKTLHTTATDFLARRPRPKRSQALTKRRLAGKLPASFLTLYNIADSERAAPSSLSPASNRPRPAVSAVPQLPHVGRRRQRQSHSPTHHTLSSSHSSSNSNPPSPPPLPPPLEFTFLHHSSDSEASGTDLPDLATMLATRKPDPSHTVDPPHLHQLSHRLVQAFRQTAPPRQRRAKKQQARIMELSRKHTRSPSPSSSPDRPLDQPNRRSSPELRPRPKRHRTRYVQPLNLTSQVLPVRQRLRQRRLATPGRRLTSHRTTFLSIDTHCSDNQGWQDIPDVLPTKLPRRWRQTNLHGQRARANNHNTRQRGKQSLASARGSSQRQIRLHRPTHLKLHDNDRGLSTHRETLARASQPTRSFRFIDHANSDLNGDTKQPVYLGASRAHQKAPQPSAHSPNVEIVPLDTMDPSNPDSPTRSKRPPYPSASFRQPSTKRSTNRPLAVVRPDSTRFLASTLQLAMQSRSRSKISRTAQARLPFSTEANSIQRPSLPLGANSHLSAKDTATREPRAARSERSSLRSNATDLVENSVAKTDTADLTSLDSQFPSEPEELPADHQAFSADMYAAYRPSVAGHQPSNPTLPTISDQPAADVSHPPIKLAVPQPCAWFDPMAVTYLPMGLTFSGKSYIGKGHLAQLLACIRQLSARDHAHATDRCVDQTSALAVVIPTAVLNYQSFMDQLHLATTKAPLSQSYIFGQLQAPGFDHDTWRQTLESNRAHYYTRWYALVNHDASQPALTLPRPRPNTQPSIHHLEAHHALGQPERRANVDECLEFLESTMNFIHHGLAGMDQAMVQSVVPVLLAMIDEMMGSLLACLGQFLARHCPCESQGDPLHVSTPSQLVPSWHQCAQSESLELTLTTMWYLLDWCVRAERHIRATLGNQSPEIDQASGPVPRAGSPAVSSLVHWQGELNARSIALVSTLVVWMYRLTLSPGPMDSARTIDVVVFNRLITAWPAQLWHCLMRLLATGAWDAVFVDPEHLAFFWSPGATWRGLVRHAQTLGSLTPVDDIPGGDASFWKALNHIILGQLHYARAWVSGLPSAQRQVQLSSHWAWLGFQAAKAWAFTFHMLPWCHLGGTSTALTISQDVSAVVPSPVGHQWDSTLVHELLIFSLLLARVGTEATPITTQYSTSAVVRLCQELGVIARSVLPSPSAQVERYASHVLSCYHRLLGYWHREATMAPLVTLYRFWADRRLDDLAIESHHSFPSFLITKDAQFVAECASAPQRTDTSFHLFLKACALSLRQWVTQYSAVASREPRLAAKRRKEVLQLISQLSPTRVMVFPSKSGARTATRSTPFTYGSLGNHYALTLLFLRVIPPTIRAAWPLAQMMSYLNFKASDFTARRVFMEALYFAWVVHIELKRDPQTVIKAFYDHWRTVAQEILDTYARLHHQPVLAPIFAHIATRTADSLTTATHTIGQTDNTRALLPQDKPRLERYQRARSKMLCSFMSYVEQLLVTLSKRRPLAPADMANVKALMTNPPWCDILEHHTRYGRKCVRAVLRVHAKAIEVFAVVYSSVYRSTRHGVVTTDGSRGGPPNERFPANAAKSLHDPTLDDGRWAIEGDLDDNDLAQLFALEEAQVATNAALPDRGASEAIADFDTLQALDTGCYARLREWVIGCVLATSRVEAIRTPSTLSETISMFDQLFQSAVWALADCARFFVSAGYKTWGHFLLPFGADSFDVVTDPALRHRLLLIFLAPILTQDQSLVIAQYEPQLLALWFETVLDHRITYQQVLTKALLTSRFPSRFLFSRLAPLLHAGSGRLTLSRQQFKASRVALVDGVLSNMGDHHKATTHYASDHCVALQHRYRPWIQSLLQALKASYTALAARPDAQQTYTQDLVHPVVGAILGHCVDLLPEGRNTMAELTFFTSGVIPSLPMAVYLGHKVWGFSKQDFAHDTVLQSAIHEFIGHEFICPLDQWPLSAIGQQAVQRFVRTLNAPSQAQGSSAMALWNTNFSDFRQYLYTHLLTAPLVSAHSDPRILGAGWTNAVLLQALLQRLSLDMRHSPYYHLNAPLYSAELGAILGPTLVGMVAKLPTSESLMWTPTYWLYYAAVARLLTTILQGIHYVAVEFPGYCSAWFSIQKRASHTVLVVISALLDQLSSSALERNGNSELVDTADEAPGAIAALPPAWVVSTTKARSLLPQVQAFQQQLSNGTDRCSQTVASSHGTFSDVTCHIEGSSEDIKVNYQV
ncbi:hypothetical protein H4R34_000581 [Dimargaris verticillata]|uniref:Mus7/MMS22 family-domain-containing protein n=1 Tax=Dimargaris verticillata TaxID=2761393 RepID=A0A9W8EBQ7_9FUNG|nr:hypothetical protein H4R34_000581 [Dimargaris verticillata]